MLTPGRRPPKPFIVQPQGIDDVSYQNWCWLAVAASVSAYYDPNTTWSQCALANGLIAGPGCDCCKTSNQSTCDDPAGGELLDSMGKLNGTNNLTRSANVVSDSEPINQLKQDIVNDVASGHPVCLRIEWQGHAGGHFVGVSKTYMQDGKLFFSISDPLNGPGDYPVVDLLTDGYGSLLKNQEFGTWTDAYFTAEAPAQ